MKEVKKRVVLITGGSSGIGKAMAIQMSSAGSRVIVCGRDREKLAALKKSYPEIFVFQADISNQKDRKDLSDKIDQQFGDLNMLINNAGIKHLIQFDGDTTFEAKIRQEWEINYMAPQMLTKAFLPLLKKNKGTLVNVTSGLVYVPLAVQPNYCATKAALHSMTRSLRMQLSDDDINVVEIFYPAVDTPFQQGMAPDFAISPEEAAAAAIKGLNRGKAEIRVGKAGLLYRLSRLMPNKAMRILNRKAKQSSRQ